MTKKKLTIIIVSLFLLLSFPVCFFGFLYHQVTERAADRIQKGAIERIIFSESPVFYDDGKTPIGVFFSKTHRKYIQYEDIPQVFINALVASEDKDFFDHWGFDLEAILRAFIANLRAGKIVQGGSTITQQTAKNIFEREKRSYMAKLKELMQALLLEKNYSKKEILEMYVNQFFVTGYGKGLRIASQYFFDKEVEDLNLVEAAFIAGSLKAPNRYNPFIKKTDSERKKAARLAKQRKNYVLDNMLSLGFISKEEYSWASKRDIPFKKGKISYPLNVILDYVRQQLESDYFREILREQGIENIATSGISVYTSIDQEIQESASRALRNNLALMDTKLSGYDVAQISKAYEKLPPNESGRPTDGLPLLAEITHIDKDNSSRHLVVSWGQGGGVIGYEGLEQIGNAWLKWKKGNRAEFGKKHVRQFLKNFSEGDLVPVKVVPSSKDSSQTRLILTKIPELNGGVVVLKRGMIKAMVGGFSNQYFNRAVHAKRQLGSAFKPIVYTAALQLSWNSLDELINMRDFFTYQDTVYVPKPDHEPPSHKVSMAWAGIKSENLATVWLLYHLTDHLNITEFKKVAKLLGLARRSNESYSEYAARIRDRHGVIVDKETLMEAAFNQAKEEVVSDVIFRGYEDSLRHVRRLHYKIPDESPVLEDLEDPVVLRLGFQRLSKLNTRMKERAEEISNLLSLYEKYDMPFPKKGFSKAMENFYRVVSGEAEGRIFYSERSAFMSNPATVPLTLQWLSKRGDTLRTEEVLIDGLIPSEILDLIRKNLESNYHKLAAYRPYDFNVLFRVSDFRALINLTYLKHLSKDLGISTELEAVLSFPLGSNSISIMEAALAYQSMMTSRLYPLTNRTDSSMVPVIKKIVDRNGEVLWEYKPRPRKVLPPRVSRTMCDILRNVVVNGTGRRAKGAVKVSLNNKGEELDLPVPAFGKTGTADQFRNSAFVGAIPGPNGETGGLDIRDGYYISIYIGYDDNRVMESTHQRIYGSSGALPIWMETAQAVANCEEYKENLELADLIFGTNAIPLDAAGDFRNIRVSSRTGLPVSLSREANMTRSAPAIQAYVESNERGWTLKRCFEPLEGVKE